jgi:hypothetical protein
MLQYLESQLGLYYEKHGKTYYHISAATKLLVDHMQVDRESDLHHIDYRIPVHDVEKQRQYTQFIARECHLQGLWLHGTQVEEWRSMLQSSILIEKLISVREKVRIWSLEGSELCH